MKTTKPPKIFNSKRRRVNRTLIPAPELAASFTILVLLVLLIFWVLGQKNNFNLNDRDISISQLSQNSISKPLYHRVLKRWSDSGFDQNKTEADLSVFPKSISEDNWLFKKDIKQFDKQNLFEKINGEAERFLDHHFKKLYYLNLVHRNQQDEIDIELYDQGDIPGSMGIFSEHRSDDNQIQQEKELIYFETTIGTIGRVENYFFRISGFNKNENTRNKIKQITKSLSELAKTEEKIDFGIFIFKEKLKIPDADISHKSQNVFQYDFARDFWFAKPDPHNKARLFVHQDTNASAVSELYAQLKIELEYEFTIIKQSQDSLLARHNYLKTYFSMKKQDNYLFGFENATHIKTMADYMDILKKELPNEK